MKKIYLLLFLLLLLTGCTSNTNQYVGNVLDIDLKECNVLLKIDNHGGFLGDGETFIKIECPNDIMIKKPNNWSEFPLSSDLEEATKLNICDADACLDLYERYNIPKEVNGYYFFKDRYSNSYDDSSLGLNDRSSYNYTFAIYDSDTKIIYYYELDT